MIKAMECYGNLNDVLTGYKCMDPLLNPGENIVRSFPLA